jgi:large subunit ribosomal protein L4e
MFGQTKIWRRWHRHINWNQRRYATASALAASAVPPLVLSDTLNGVDKTKLAKEILARFGAFADVEKADASRQIRRGVGKSRNRRHTMRRGPLVIYDKSEGIEQGFRNLPGVELTTVDNLNLLDLAPGGHLGRFCIWTQGAFAKLDTLFGTYEKGSDAKSGYHLPRSFMTNADLARIINSDEVQSVLRPAQKEDRSLPEKRNALKNPDVMAKLNPYAVTSRARAIEKSSKDSKKRAEIVKAKRDEAAARKKFVGRKREFFARASAQGTI